MKKVTLGYRLAVSAEKGNTSSSFAVRSRAFLVKILDARKYFCYIISSAARPRFDYLGGELLCYR